MPIGERLDCPVERVVEGRLDGLHVDDATLEDRDGLSRAVSYDATTVGRPREEPTGVVVVFHASPSETEAEADRLRLIARAVNDAAWDLDVDSGRLWLSSGTCSAFGFEPWRTDATLEDWIARVHPADRERVASGYALATREGRCFQQEYRLLAHGDRCAVLERGYVVRDEGGAPVRVFVALMDVTQRRAAQDRLERLNEGLEREVERRTEQLRLVNADLERFSYSVSHDLRASLRNIAFSATTVREEAGEGLSPDGREALDRVVRSARRMSDLIESLLRHATLAHFPLELQRVSLTDLARSVAADVVRRQECDARIAVQEGMVVHGDVGLLAVLLENLIVNIFKYNFYEKIIKKFLQIQREGRAAPRRDRARGRGGTRRLLRARQRRGLRSSPRGPAVRALPALPAAAPPGGLSRHRRRCRHRHRHRPRERVARGAEARRRGVGRRPDRRGRDLLLHPRLSPGIKRASPLGPGPGPIGIGLYPGTGLRGAVPSLPRSREPSPRGTFAKVLRLAVGDMTNIDPRDDSPNEAGFGLEEVSEAAHALEAAIRRLPDGRERRPSTSSSARRGRSRPRSGLPFGT